MSKHNRNLINCTLFFSTLLISSCASFSNKVLKNSNKSVENNISKFKGIYQNIPKIIYKEKGKQEKIYKGNTTVLQKFLFTETLALDTSTTHYIEIKSINNAQLFFSLIRGKQLVDSITIGGKLKNGMFYLDNKVFRCHGIPYLLGGCERKRIRLATNNNHDLIVHETYDNSGAFLLFFWAGTSYNRAYVYSTTKND